LMGLTTSETQEESSCTFEPEPSLQTLPIPETTFNSKMRKSQTNYKHPFV
jgi:hypothetical protein